MLKNLVTFGDSWTSGYCGDLYQEIPNFHKNNIIEVKHNAWHFLNAWPKLLAKKLNLSIQDYSHSGCSNKSMVTLLYDSYILGNLNPNTDYVVILFSTWHREAVWSNIIDNTIFNYKFFKNTGDRYTSSSILDYKPFEEIDNDVKKRLSFEMFLNFYSAINFLESKKFNYKIGWAFTYITDFEPYIDKKYIGTIKSNKNLIDTMVNYCKSIKSFEKLFHPTQEDHELYSLYLYKKIKNEKLF
jgi:hypothetical protein